MKVHQYLIFLIKTSIILHRFICRLFFDNKLYTHFLNFILQLCLTLLVHQLRQLHYSFEAAVKWGWGIFFFGGGITTKHLVKVL